MTVELRSALRALRATPVVTLVVILSLALAIGANTAMFSLVDSLLLRVLPVERADRLVSVEPSRVNAAWSYAAWRQIHARRQTLFADVLAFRTTRFNLSPRGRAEHVDGLMVSGRYFDMLGVKPMLGRTFNEDDDRDGGGKDGAVAVISYAFWQRRYNGAADAVGRTLIVDRVPFTIAGVTGPGFFGIDVGRTFDVAVPIGADRLFNGASSLIDRPGWTWLRVIARLKDGQTLDAAEQALRGVQPQIREATRDPNAPVPPAAAGTAARDTHLAQPFQLTSAALGTSAMRGTYRQPMLVAMAVVALVLLIACANVANLFLARAAARRHELSVRVALGAPRWRLARQLIVEILLIAGAGALGGLAIALWASRLLVRLLPGGKRAIGQRFRSAFTRPGRPNPWMEIVGVVGDATYRRLRDELPPTFYVPIAQWASSPGREFPSSLRLSVRAAAGGASGARARGAAAQLAHRVADAVGRVDPALGLTFTPLARQIDDTLARERVLAMLSAFFGGLALLLSALGLYGLMAYSVSRRRREIGIRMALGAEARTVVRMVLGRVLLLVGIGVAAGAAATMWVSRYVEALLYGVTREDPRTLIAAAVVLVVVGCAAGWIPARRASRIDPARVLHGE